MVCRITTNLKQLKNEQNVFLVIWNIGESYHESAFQNMGSKNAHIFCKTVAAATIINKSWNFVTAYTSSKVAILVLVFLFPNIKKTNRLFLWKYVVNNAF